MREELLDTVIKLYRSEIEDNIYLADNIVIENGYDGRQASIIYNAMYSNLTLVNKCMIMSRVFFTLLTSKERQEYEKEIKEKLQNKIIIKNEN